MLSQSELEDNKTPLDIAVSQNNHKLLDQILAYNGMHIDLHRQLDNLEQSHYKPVDMIAIMDKLCHYGGWQDVQHDGYEYLLDRVLNKGPNYFDLGLVIINRSNSNSIDINRELLANSTKWEQFLRYAAKKGEARQFQLIASDEALINAINWENANVGHEAASCENEHASEVIDSLITILATKYPGDINQVNSKGQTPR